ncbi:MAG: 1-acyl-sn-glycerol-3-phosphate acyltransferase [Clostridia bacterium]|nr:1-acyl-sn-glycerol-3-phosphate acyltransferase [Clostridia bacterium]
MWLYLRPKIYRMGKEKLKGAGIVMSNHVGLIDIVHLHFCFAGRRMWSLAMKELFETKIKNLFFRMAKCIPVDRENVTIDMYHDVADVLDSGKLLIIFPEGHINFDEKPDVKNFKGGVALFAIMNKVPVVPVYIVKRQKWYHRQKIVLGEPIHLEKVCGGTPSIRDVDKVSIYLHEKEEELARYYNEKCLKKKRKDND